MKILITDKVAPSCIEGLKKLGHEVNDAKDLPKDQIPSIIGEYEVLVIRSKTKVRKEIIDAAKSLKLIIRGGVGIDNIDVEYAQQNEIHVMNTPEASSLSVAELAFGMMLAASRNIGEANQTMKDGKWEKKRLAGNEVAGKTVGIVGFGRIGRAFAKRALAFDMKVIAYDKFLEKSPMSEVPLVSFDELVKKSDIMTLHIPFIKEDGPTFTKTQFDMMKDGVILVNCARGGVVEEKALLEALNSGKVKSAGIDVYESEPTNNQELVNHAHTICSPHLGASTKEAQIKVGEQIIKIVQGYEKK